MTAILDTYNTFFTPSGRVWNYNEKYEDCLSVVMARPDFAFKSIGTATLDGDSEAYSVGAFYLGQFLVCFGIESDSPLSNAICCAVLTATKQKLLDHINSVPETHVLGDVLVRAVGTPLPPSPVATQADDPVPEPEGSCTCRECVEHEDPSTNVCGNCDCVLHDWVHIYCLVHTDGEETTFCSDCWQTHRKEMKAEGWKDANAEWNNDGFSSDEDD